MKLKLIFWILWAIEFLFMLWWLLDDLQYMYLSVNPFVYVGFVWLFAALAAFQGMKNKWPGLVLVIIPGIPLFIMAIFLLIILLVSIFDGPIRWN